LDIEQTNSQQFYATFLNNIRALVKLFDGLFYKHNFIALPGDEIVEKKHKNIKHLMAMEQNISLAGRATRKFPGLGAPIFKVDFEKQFPDSYGKVLKEERLQMPPTQPVEPVKAKGGKNEPPPVDEPKFTPDGVEVNEVNTDVDLQNTDQHKAIIKARNEHYLQFKRRFEGSLSNVLSKFDEIRGEEMRFRQYWADNLKELTVKHI